MNAYQRRNERRFLASFGRVGLRIDLGEQGQFWSRGWPGCDRCGQSIRHETPLYPFEIHTPDGQVRRGWRCLP